MIHFPRLLNEIYQFETNGQLYIVDMPQGVVIPIDSVISAILEDCTTHTTEQIIENLSKNYGRAAVMKGMRSLEKIQSMGLLFSNQPVPSKKLTSRSDRRQLLVSHTVITELKRRGLITNLNIHYLLNALVKDVDVYFAIPEHHRDEVEQLPEMSIEGIHKVYFKPGWTFSVSDLLPKCDAILSLSSLSTWGLSFFKQRTVPTIERVSSDSLYNSLSLNAVFAKCAAAKPCDAIVFDAWWVKEIFARFTPESCPLYDVLPGMTVTPTNIVNRKTAKQRLAHTLGRETILNQPLIGLVSALKSPHSVEKIGELTAANQEFLFFLIDSGIEGYFQNGPENLLAFGFRTIQDYEILPIIFEALDLGCLFATPGVSASLLVDGLACGLPFLIVGNVEPPKYMGQGCAFVKSAGEPSFEDEEWPMEEITKELKRIIRNDSIRHQMEDAALHVANQFTWEKTAVRLLEIINRSISNWPGVVSGEKFPILFCPYYNRAQQRLEARALQLPNLEEYTIEEGIESALKGNHTQMELETVMRYLKMI